MITKSIVALDAVRDHLPVRSGYDKFDDRLTQFIAVATQQIEQLTRRSFTYQAQTQYFRTVSTGAVSYDWSGSSPTGLYVDPRSTRYCLRGMPIDTGETFSLYYDPTGAFDETTLVDPAYYVIDPEQGTMVVRLPTVEHPRALKAVYSSGFAVGDDDTLNDSAPQDLRLACITQVIAMWNRLAPDNLGMDSDRGQNNKNATFRKFSSRGALTPEASGMIFSYRQPLLGLS